MRIINAAESRNWLTPRRQAVEIDDRRFPGYGWHMMEDTQQHDHDSGLVERTWTRTVGKDGKPGRNGVMTEQALTGKEVTASWIDPNAGGVRHAAGTVRRNDAGRLVIESWAEGVRRETEVTRDANVDIVGRR
jgi:hypothetical protein